MERVFYFLFLAWFLLTGMTWLMGDKPLETVLKYQWEAASNLNYQILEKEK